MKILPRVLKEREAGEFEVVSIENLWGQKKAFWVVWGRLVSPFLDLVPRIYIRSKSKTH